jgi:hypothetical protein
MTLKDSYTREETRMGLDGPAREIIVEPQKMPAPDQEPAPEKTPAKTPAREPVPA